MIIHILLVCFNEIFICHLATGTMIPLRIVIKQTNKLRLSQHLVRFKYFQSNRYTNRWLQVLSKTICD